jgi:4-azaleucine resistance transporter AzlC
MNTQLVHADPPPTTAPTIARPPGVDATATSSLLALALRDVASVAFGMVSFGVTLGVAIAVLGFGTVAGIFGGGVVYGGSAQLTAVTLLHQGVALAGVVASAAIVNARLLLYSASIAPRFRRQPQWFRWFAPHFIIDQTFLLSSARPELTGAAFRRYWCWLGLTVLVVWCSSIAFGILAGPFLPVLPHLIFVGSALFIGMLAPRLTSRPAVATAGAAGAAAALVGYVRPELGILAGAIAGVLAGRSVSQ